MKTISNYRNTIERPFVVLAFVIAGLFADSNLSGQETESGEDLLKMAEQARRNTSARINGVELNQLKQLEQKHTGKTIEQIRSQLDLANELDEEILKSKTDRHERIRKMKSEVDQILMQLNNMKTARSKMQHSDSATFRNDAQISNTKSLDPPSDNEDSNNLPPGKKNTTDPGIEFKKTPDQIPKTPNILNLNGSEGEREFSTMGRDPVNKLGLANNLVAIGSYRTAARMYQELLKEKSYQPEDLNWIRLQLGLCYRKLGSLPEAGKNLRDAANSSRLDVSRETAIWWLNQIESQKRIADTMKSMDEKLETIRKNNESLATN